MVKADPIWILESEPSCLALYHQTLGLQYPLRVFSNFSEFSKAFDESPAGQPRLLIAEPEDAKGLLLGFFKAFANSPTPARFPETMIVSRNDEIDQMRAFLLVGVRDYLLKPLRPSELIAKVERALTVTDNQSVLIFRNKLDGKEVANLTFREHQILTVLLNKPSRIADRTALIDAVWNQTLVNRKTLDVHVFNLRRKLRPIGYDIVCKEQCLHLAKLNRTRS